MKFIIDPKIKHRIRLISWTAFAVLVGISITSLFLNNSWYKEIFHLKANFSSLHESKKNTASVVQVIAGAKVEEAVIKSQYYYINKDTNGGPKVSAKAFLVGDLNTGEVILSKNQDEKFPIASVSKLMTALVAKQIMKPNDTAKISKTVLATEGTNGELHLGQKIQISNLLYPLLLESSNDAAEAIAEYFNRDNFISKMNEAAQSLKMSSTSYGDPSGLSKNNQST